MHGISLRPLNKLGSPLQRCYMSSSSNVIVFSEKRVVGYSMDNMFRVVSDVDKYHKFVPHCRKSVVTLKQDNRLSANLVVGFQPFLNIAYTSHNIAHKLAGD